MESDESGQDEAPARSWSEWGREAWASCWGLDVRSLALLRIGACSVYLWELLSHWQYIEAYLTDGGFVPRNALFEGGGGWSIYLSTGSLDGARILYLCHLTAVALLLVGWHTRWSSLACYVFAYSFQHRFPALPGWETEIRMLFLIGVFLPWGEYFSLDSRGRPPQAPTQVVSAATAAWRVQVAVLYLASGLLKGGTGWAEGTAVEVSLASDAYCNPVGLWLLAQLKHAPQSLIVLNFAVPLIEIFSPLFLLCPIPWVQMAWVVVLWALHAGFGVCLNIGVFSLICSACLLGFLPASVWSLGDRSAAPIHLPRPPLQRWQSLLLIWLAASMVITAAEDLPELKGTIRKPAHEPWTIVGVEQHWGMFVPPPFEGGWHVIKGKTAQGRWVDLLQPPALNRDASEERPEWIQALYPGVRGYLFLASYLRNTDESKSYIRDSVVSYYRRRWENAHPQLDQRIVEAEALFFRRQYTPGKGFGEAERILLHTQKQL